MKKALMLLTAVFVLTISAVCASAKTDYADYTPERDKYSIIYDVGAENASGMYGLVAIKGIDTELDFSDLSVVRYIDQTSADGEGKISFIEFAPRGTAPSSKDFEECTVFIGGPGYDTAETIGYLRMGTATYLLGDIDGSGEVDIDDAILLFQYSVLPDFYPIEYAGDVDFDKSGEIDIDDAILLFQYSVLPDFYPIG